MVPGDYRRTAAQCFALAAIMKDPESKAALIAMGRAWLSLAELVDRSESAAPELPKNLTPKRAMFALPRKPDPAAATDALAKTRC